MMGTEYIPRSGDRILVLDRGGILIVNPKDEPVIIHGDGTRETLKATDPHYTVAPHIDRLRGGRWLD